MLSLRDLQERFVATLFGELPESEAAAWIGCAGSPRSGHDAGEAAARLAIYRNNLREGFIEALSLEFPVIERLVGNDYFRQLAGEFQRLHPSRAGDLHAVGAPFPDYLHAQYGSTEYAYLSDVAALEWAYQQSAIAADAPAFDPQSLAGVAPESYGRLHFKLHPACGLIRSAYPILRIWETNQAEAVGEQIVDLGSGADHVVTRRSGDGVELRRIPPAEFALLEAFAGEAALDEALAAAQRLDPAFDLGAALRRAICLGLLTDSYTHLLASNEGTSP